MASSRGLISCVEDSRANHIASRGNERGQLMSVIFGESSPASFAALGPDGSWLKTCRGYSQVTLDGSLEEYCETWPRAGMMRSGIAYQLQPLAPLTGEIASGSWDTPSAADAHPRALARHGPYWGPGQKHLQAQVYNAMSPIPIAVDGNPSRCGPWISEILTPQDTGRKRTWPTPIAGDAHLSSTLVAAQRRMQEGRLTLSRVIRLWLTPRSANPGSRIDSIGGRVLAQEVEIAEGIRSPDTGRRYWLTPCSQNQCSGKVRKDYGNSRLPQGAVSGQLNPTWVEWLMGFPLGWTDLGH